MRDVNPETITGTLSWQWIQSYPCKTKSSHETEKSSVKLLEPSHRTKVVSTDNSMEFGKACEDLSWNHRTSTLHRSETIGIAERAVRRVKEGTSAVLLQSGLDERWWSDNAMLLLLAKRPRPPGQRENAIWKTKWRTIQGPIKPFGTFVEYHLVSPKDLARIHQVGKKVLTGIFLGYELIVGGIWKGDILIADLEDLQKLDASDFYLRRINAKQVLIRQKVVEFMFPFVDGAPKLSGRDNKFREPAPRQESTVRSEDLSGEVQGESERLDQQNQQMTLKPVPTFGRCKVTSSIVITMNLEFNSTCRRKKHSLLHRNIWMLPGLLILIWMSCKKKVLTITGMSIRTSICQTRGNASRNLLCWRRNLQRDRCGPGRDWQRFQRPPDQIMHGQKFGRKFETPLRIEKKQKWAKGETEARQCSKVEKNLFYWSRRQGIFGNFQKCKEKTG